jgi:hypothetical protein
MIEIPPDPKTLIPAGHYCYAPGEVKVGTDGLPYMKTTLCPFWSIDREQPPQNNGYCSYLEEGDWEGVEGFGLLWDQIKSCGVNQNFHDLEDTDEIAAWMIAMMNADDPNV